MKRREICAILGVGCSRATAARYVGCSPATIRREAARDAAFAESLSRAEEQAEITWMTQIQKAAKKEQYWRAAAWALERCRPERYAARGPDVITVPQIVRMLAQMAEIIVAEIPVPRYRKAVLKRFDTLRAELENGEPRHKGKQESLSVATRSSSPNEADRDPADNEEETS